ncbi:hypothetical protein [Chitinophaga sp. YR627]|uniref:hypothetical protein n=1 Tax=Chitinophaga sp. YR627 TaxID=1881041 RepID=UPI001160B758|nr:hypothetical protein [Chitinophaga sp. YR627]
MLRFKGLEPYPALLLPENAATSPDVSYTLLYGQTPAGSWEELNPANFGYPIPTQYMVPVIKRLSSDYNADPGSYKSILLGKLHLADRYHLTAEDKKIADQWFQERLHRCGMDTSAIKLVTYKQQLDVDAAGNRPKTITHEQIIHFNR